MVPKIGDRVRFRDEFIDKHIQFFGQSNLIGYKKTVFEVIYICKKLVGSGLYGIKLKYFNYRSSAFGTYHDTFYISKDDGTFNGTIACVVFELESCNIVDTDPKNNDGRAICFWCNVATQKRGGGIYDVCPKCGK